MEGEVSCLTRAGGSLSSTTGLKRHLLGPLISRYIRKATENLRAPGQYEIKRQLYESLHVHENAASERSLRRAKFLPWRGGLDPLALELTRQAWFMPLSSSGPGPVTDDPQVPLGRAQRDLPSLVAGTLPLS